MREITPETWARWKNNSTTKLFLQYIDDFRQQTGREIAIAIADGEILPDDAVSTATIRCQTYLDVLDITHSQINEFYNPTQEEEPDVDS